MKLALPALAALLTLSAAALAAVPIPQNQASSPGSSCSPATRPSRTPSHAPRMPRHPFMAANGRNAVHNDAYQTDTYRNSGPLGGDLRVFSQSIDGRGGLGSLRHHDRLRQARPPDHHLHLRHDGRAAPDGPGRSTRWPSHLLPPRIIPPGVNPLQTPGGAYFYVDDKDRAVVSIGRQIFVVAIKGNTLAARPHLRPQPR